MAARGRRVAARGRDVSRRDRHHGFPPVGALGRRHCSGGRVQGHAPRAAWSCLDGGQVEARFARVQQRAVARGRGAVVGGGLGGGALLDDAEEGFDFALGMGGRGEERALAA